VMCGERRVNDGGLSAGGFHVEFARPMRALQFSRA
jgi:hypothetical protein